jgi:hypothetical protein
MSGPFDIAIFGFDAKKGALSPDDVRNALMLLVGEIRPEGAITKTVYPSDTTKPTRDECRAALSRVLNESAAELYSRDRSSDLAFVLNILARCFSPTGSYERFAEVRNRGKGYETDEVRDNSIAGLVWRLTKTKGPKRAVGEAAAMIGRSMKAVRDACKRVEKRIADSARERGEKICPECKGSGEIGEGPGRPPKCPTCSGSGFVPL